MRKILTIFYYFCHPRFFANPSSRTVLQNLIQLCNTFHLIHLIQKNVVVQKCFFVVSLLLWKLNGALCFKHDKGIQSSKNENYLSILYKIHVPKHGFSDKIDEIIISERWIENICCTNAFDAIVTE